jgi:teichuronic acid biosynthesis glycosyltransferase TuaG
MNSHNFIKNKVSIIIPTFNRFDFVMNAIESAREQTYFNKEIIVVDDCSTDERYNEDNFPKDIIYKRLDVNNRIKYNTGCANGITRNECIKISSGEYLAFLDDDDYYFKDKIEMQIKYMKKYGYLFSSTNLLKGYGPYKKSLNQKIFFNHEIGREIDHGVYEIEYNHIRNNNLIALSSVIIHKSIINEMGEFEIGVNEDYRYWLKIIHRFKCLYINKPTLYYDINHGNGKLYSDR